MIIKGCLVLYMISLLASSIKRTKMDHYIFAHDHEQIDHIKLVLCAVQLLMIHYRHQTTLYASGAWDELLHTCMGQTGSKKIIRDGKDR